MIKTTIEKIKDNKKENKIPAIIFGILYLIAIALNFLGITHYNWIILLTSILWIPLLMFIAIIFITLLIIGIIFIILKLTEKKDEHR